MVVGVICQVVIVKYYERTLQQVRGNEGNEATFRGEETRSNAL